MIIGYGHKNFDRQVKKFERNTIKEVKRIVAETAEIAVTQMKALAPISSIDGGNLKNSIGITYAKGGLTAIINSGASYSLYIEVGTGIYSKEGTGRKTPWVYFDKKLNRYVFTRGMRPMPFFYPSLEVAFKHFVKEMK